MVVVAQLGARMHYAVPAILARSGMLERLYTDIYSPQLPRPLRTWASQFGPAPLRRWLGRIPADIPQEKIVAFTAMGLEYYKRRRFAASSAAITEIYLWAGREFCRNVIRRGLGDASGVYTYNSAGLELLEHARTAGKLAVMEQTMASGVVEDELLQEEERAHPQWAQSRAKDPFRPAFCERERLEWEAANVILCGSEFVRDSIVASGGPGERCRVIPYGVSLHSSPARKERIHRPLRVLVAGAVGLRKGAPYVLAAARSLRGNAEFRMAGQLDITAHAQTMLREHATLLGAVPRAEMHQQFAWADVFLLPTLCEGSATVCYEALAHGLPVITTLNAGSVVRDGVDGFLVPIRNSEAIQDRIERLANDEDLWAAMSTNALARASDYTLEKYGERLLQVLNEVKPAA